MKLSLLFLVALSSLSAQTYQPTWDSIDKRPTPARFTDAKFGIFVHWGVYSVPAYAPVIPGKLAYAEWYWHAMTEGKDDPKANPVETGTWAFHQKWRPGRGNSQKGAARRQKDSLWTYILFSKPLPRVHRTTQSYM